MDTTEIYTLSLHDALPICSIKWLRSSEQEPRSERRGAFDDEDTAEGAGVRREDRLFQCEMLRSLDRKSTRLNSSHVEISYAVFCLKKKRKRTTIFCAGSPV